MKCPARAISTRGVDMPSSTISLLADSSGGCNTWCFFLVLQPPLESAFLVFPESKQPPKLVEYFGKALPYAMTGLLVVYALRNTPILTGSHGIPELIACAVITLLHLWKRNMLLSTAGGTAVYMLLIQLVF